MSDWLSPSLCAPILNYSQTKIIPTAGDLLIEAASPIELATSIPRPAIIRVMREKP
jgi:hypothetical protein